MWALSLLLNNSHALKKFQQELDLHVGKERQVDESDMTKLVYLNAVVKETLRLYPTVPLSAPHESMEQCTVGGYHVPKGTRLMTHVYGQILISSSQRDFSQAIRMLMLGANTSNSFPSEVVEEFALEFS